MAAGNLMSGSSQAAKAPRKNRLDAKLTLKPCPRNLGRAFDLLVSLPDDFMQEGKQDKELQEYTDGAEVF
ncbi:MAG: AbrB/MazE/SpoVT family DNA-binding domain-containing protein [Marinospirillum sp.]|uniref:hypothetical protein n=1 Tax=Marinospirillum sp. TaxID=2183934 RepID=UPI0019DD6C01|nr:hypothetical protein [Marinospirillum sp.]MBE0508762.1 AbrB/MazE/SpoVT family DNA-binding domain-containing protein [Marinospirillum sp.]